MAKNYFGANSAKKLMALIASALKLKIDKTSIVANLTTADPGSVLDATQGKVLDDKITAMGTANTEALALKLDANKVGVAGGAASLDDAGQVPSSQLPSYVDDVLEGYFNSADDTFNKEYTAPADGEETGTYTEPYTGEKGKIYVDLNTNVSYRWSGSTYIKITSSDLVELSDTEVETLWNAAIAEANTPDTPQEPGA